MYRKLLQLQLLMPHYYRGKESALRMLRVLRAPGAVSYTWQPPSTEGT